MMEMATPRTDHTNKNHFHITLSHWHEYDDVLLPTIFNINRLALLITKIVYCVSDRRKCRKVTFRVICYIFPADLLEINKFSVGRRLFHRAIWTFQSEIICGRSGIKINVKKVWIISLTTAHEYFHERKKTFCPVRRDNKMDFSLSLLFCLIYLQLAIAQFVQCISWYDMTTR